MNTAIFRRLLWKEFRTMCGFWLAMAMLALLSLVIPLASKQGIIGQMSERTAACFYCFAPLFVALYAAGCGAMLFSSERETRTYWFLRNLPAAGMRIVFGKVGFAVASSLLLFGLVSGMGPFLGRFYLPAATDQLRIWIVCLVLQRRIDIA